MERGFIQLPNGDLWKGVDIDAAPRVDTVDDRSAPATAEDYVAELVASQKGEVLTCTHCGSQFSRKQLNELRDHFEAFHKAALTPVTDEQALAMTALSGAKITKA